VVSTSSTTRTSSAPGVVSRLASWHLNHPGWCYSVRVTLDRSPGRSTSRPRSSAVRQAIIWPATTVMIGRQDTASSTAYAGLMVLSMMSSRSSNGRNADFIALIVNQRRSFTV